MSPKEVPHLYGFLQQVTEFKALPSSAIRIKCFDLWGLRTLVAFGIHKIYNHFGYGHYLLFLWHSII
jgi:hypothetical protein